MKNVQKGALQTSIKIDEYLVADLSWDARKLRVVGKSRQVFYSLKKWGCSNTAPVSIFF